MRLEVVVPVLCLSLPALAQDRRGPTFELGAPKFTFPHEGTTEVGTSVLAEGVAEPLVEVIVYDRVGEPLALVKSDDEGRWAVSVATPAGPTQLEARARFLNVLSEPANVHFTMLRDDAVEGGGCSAASGLPLLLGASWVLRRRRR